MLRTKSSRNMTFGFFGSLEPTVPMGYFQMHNEIEINFAYNSFEYTIGGKQICVPARRLILFWAINPHEITWMESKHSQHFHITIPLPWFLNWQLPPGFVRRVLSGEVSISSDLNISKNDEYQIELWCKNLASDDAILHSAVLFELQGRLLRFASNLGETNTLYDDRSNKSASDYQMEKVAKMAKFVAEHGHEDIGIAEIAAIANLHPNYATNLFHEICGVSLIRFLITHRITLAQMLLASTTKKIITIAFECGFNSVSQFYSHFKKLNKITPSQFRHDIKHKNLSHLAKHFNEIH